MTPNSYNAPAPKGSIVSIYATGEGQTLPGGIDGLMLSGTTLPKPVQPVTVTVDGKPAEVLYAGAVPGAVSGLLQVNARVPFEAASGVVTIQIQVGNTASQPGTTIAVK